MGLFDTYKSPEEVQRGIRQEGIAEDIQRGGMTGWQAIGAAAYGGGRQLGQALGGEDPRMDKARKIQDIQNVIAQSGLTPDQPEFYSKSAELLREVDPKMALNAMQQGADLKRTLKSEGIKNRYMEAQTEAMKTPKSKAQSAIGKLAADLTAGRISEDEYRLGIENMKKRGTKFTIDADGNITFEEGPGITGKVSAPTKKTTNDLQKDVVSGISTLNDLDRISNSYKKDYLTYQGQAAAWALGKIDKAGIPIGKKGTNLVKGKRAFKSGVDQFFNSYRKEITGAAAAYKELELLKDSLFSQDLGPVEFEAAFDELRDKIQQQVEFKQKLLSEGIPVNEIWKRMDAGEWKAYTPQELAAQPGIGEQNGTFTSSKGIQFKVLP